MLPFVFFGCAAQDKYVLPIKVVVTHLSGIGEDR